MNGNQKTPRKSYFVAEKCWIGIGMTSRLRSVERQGCIPWVGLTIKVLDRYKLTTFGD